FVILPPDEPMVSGSKKVRSWLEAYPAVKQFDPEFDHIEGQDHFAVGYGHYTITIEAKGTSTKTNGKFVNTYRRDDHGKWLCACQIWNSNAPAATR
ncbi:MAG TPA: nuclear transport factor 2 family protein, partial [Gemmatimonadales bacterium]